MHRGTLLNTLAAHAAARLAAAQAPPANATTTAPETPGSRIGGTRLLSGWTGPRALRVGDRLTLRRQPIALYNPCGVDACIDGQPYGIAFFRADIARRLDAGEHLVARIEHAEPLVPETDGWRYTLGVYLGHAP